MRKTFDIFRYVDDLLEVLVLTVVEDRIVNDDAVDGWVGVGGDDGFFDVVAGDMTEGVEEPTLQQQLSM